MEKYLSLILTLLILPSLTHAETAFVERVINGDTIELTTGEIVSLIGVHTPELKESSKPGEDIKKKQTLVKQASDYTRKHLEGEQIELEFDPDNACVNHKDKYGRLLAYVYYELSPKYNIPFNLRANGRWVMFNARIIAEGYAYAYTKFPFKYIDEFKKYEKEAKENKRGLWANDDF